MKRLFITVLFSFSVYADVLTLKECVDKTLSSHPDIRTFALKHSLSKEEQISSSAAKYPQVEIHAQYDPVKTFTLSRNSGFDTKNDSMWEVGVSLKQNLWDFSKTKSRVEASKISKEMAKLTLEDIKRVISYRVKTMYLQLALSLKTIEVRKKDVESKKAFYEQAKALKKQGLKTDADTFRFLAALYKAKDLLNSSKNDFLKVKSSLELYMNEKIPSDVKLEDDILENSEKFSLKELKRRLLSNNISLKEAKKDLKKSSYIYKSVKSEKYGSFDLVGSYSHIDALFEYDSSLVGISYGMPLFTGGKLKAEEQKAKIAKMIAKEKIESKKIELLDELSSLFFDLQSLDWTIKARKMEIEALKKAKNVIEGRYKEGLSTYMEVLDAQALLLAGNLSLLQTEYEKNIKVYKVKYLTGTDNE